MFVQVDMCISKFVISKQRVVTIQYQYALYCLYFGVFLEIYARLIKRRIGFFCLFADAKEALLM